MPSALLPALLPQPEDLLRPFKDSQRCRRKLFGSGRTVSGDEGGGVDAIAPVQGITFPRFKAGSLVYFEVEVGEPGIVPGAHRPQLLSTRNHRARGHGKLFEMAIQAVGQSPIRQTVPQDDHLAPLASPVSRKNDMPVARRIHRVSEIRIATADSVQIVAQMIHLRPLVHLEEGLGVVGKGSRLGTEGLLKKSDRREKEAREGIMQKVAPVKGRDAAI